MKCRCEPEGLLAAYRQLQAREGYRSVIEGCHRDETYPEGHNHEEGRHAPHQSVFDPVQ